MRVNAVMFSRVSTREQAEEGYSLQAQEKLIKEYAEKKDYSVVKVFSVPESARGLQERKLFNELLVYLDNHSNIKVVVCEKVDRITRNFKDAVKLDEWLNADENRQIHFVKQNLIIHKLAKSNEKFMWDIYLAMARQYSNNLSEEARKGLLEKVEQGWYAGSHKRGYKTVGEMGRKTWLIDNSNSEANFIKKAFEFYSTGNYTLRTLSLALHKLGWLDKKGEPIHIGELHKLLSDCFYCGEFTWKEKHYPNAKHPKLISKETFYLVQDLLHRQFKAGKYRKHAFLFGDGFVVCDCGRCVTWELQKGHHYGRCTKFKTNCARKKYIKEEIIENKILEVLDSFIIQNPRILEWVRKALKESHKDENNFHLDTINYLEARKNLLENRLSMLYDDRLDGRITKEFYDQKRKQYEDQIELLIESINQHTKANIDYMKLGMNIFELSQRGREIYQNKAFLQEKKELLHFIFSNLKIKNDEIVPTFQNGFQVIAERAKKGNWQALVDDFRTANWLQIVPYPEIVYQKSRQFLQIQS